MNKVQLILIPLFIIAVIVAVMIFSGALPGFRTTKVREGTEIKFWSGLDQQKIEQITGEYRRLYPGLKLTYRAQSEPDYYRALIEEFASLSGPDVFTFNQERILKFKDTIFPASFEAFSLRKFKDSFPEEGEIFISKDGILGFPFWIDPLVLYWNQDLFKNEGLAKPPETWDEFLTHSQKLTKIGAADIILQSGSAMGEFGNVGHAKEILALLILQSGNPIIDRENMRVMLAEYLPRSAVRGGEGAIRFFNEFKDSRKKTWSWAKSLPLDKDAFLQNKLAMYFGFASEYQEIKEKNPYLNFEVALVPQVRGAKNKVAYGRIHSLSISKISQNKKLAFDFINYLTSPDAQKIFQEKFFLPSSLNSLLAFAAKDPTMEIFRQSALVSRAWLDPDPEKTYLIFKDMAESAFSGKKRLDQAVDEAAEKLKTLLRASANLGL